MYVQWGCYEAKRRKYGQVLGLCKIHILFNKGNGGSIILHSKADINLQSPNFQPPNYQNQSAPRNNNENIDWVGIHKRYQAQVEPRNQLKFTAVYTKLQLILAQLDFDPFYEYGP